MNDQDWDDYAWQREGTFWGDQARRDNEGILNIGRGSNTRRSSGSHRPAQPRKPMAGELALQQLLGRLDDRIRASIDRVTLKTWLLIGALSVVVTVITGLVKDADSGLLFWLCLFSCTNR